MILVRMFFASTLVYWGTVCGSLSAAEFKLGCLFNDHMVLQREKPVAIWGWADAGTTVSVAFAGQTKSTIVPRDGKWMVTLDPMPASAEGRTIVVKDGERSMAINDVLVGEVWLGSGQSNMAMTVNRARDFEKEQAASKLPLIRAFKEGSATAKTAQADGQGRWEVCSPDTVGGFSATLFFFGRELHRELNIPIGLINSSVGGTPIEAWIDAETQRTMPELQAFFEYQAAEQAAFDETKAKADYAKALLNWEQARAKAKAAGKKAPTKPRDPVEARNRKLDIGGLFNGKIAPLIPYTMRGFIWYQGEANAQPGKSTHYHHQLALLVRDWRKRWGEELPAAWVQLPGFGREGEYWMEVREEMLKTLSLPRTGMAIAIDLGEEKDIHPKNKQDVGKRLALWALGDVYSRPVGATMGPIPIEHGVDGNTIRVKFANANGGLKLRDAAAKGFVICGADNAWKEADIRIEGDQIFASHRNLSKPVALRYNWAPFPNGNLVNSFDLPATPFRTDAPR